VPSFDVHQHLWPDALVAALHTRSKPPRLVGGTLELAEGSFPADLGGHSLDERLDLLDRHGLDVGVVSLQPTLDLAAAPELAAAYNEGVGELLASSRGRLRAFAAGECLDGLAGACVPAGEVVTGLGTLPGRLAAAGQTLFVHPGPPASLPLDAPSWWSPVVDYAAQMQAAFAAWLADGADRHPDLPVVFAFLAGGAPVQLERLASRGGDANAALRANVYFEISSYGSRALELCLATYGFERLLFGSDAPVLDPGPGLRALAGLGGALAQTVLETNASRLFG
jgi:6-methylsalicylate decarboxylase